MDLRDGIRLARLYELLTGDSLVSKLKPILNNNVDEVFFSYIFIYYYYPYSFELIMNLCRACRTFSLSWEVLRHVVWSLRANHYWPTPLLTGKVCSFIFIYIVKISIETFNSYLHNNHEVNFLQTAFVISRHRERTLQLLWAIVIYFGATFHLNEAMVAKELHSIGSSVLFTFLL
jgi:hypothetical protein